MTDLIRKIFVNELFELLNRGPLATAKQFDVSISFVVKLMHVGAAGHVKADKYGGWKKSKLAPQGDRIRALVMEKRHHH